MAPHTRVVAPFGATKAVSSAQLWREGYNRHTDSGGDAFVFGSGSAVNLITSSGGFGFVSSGGTLNSATMSGGFLDVESGASATGTVVFGSAGGTLQLDEAKT
jgi:hypothetical protein